jgi:hypothetical protein
MKTMTQNKIVAAFLVMAGALFPLLAQAHCDTMNGPVVTAAKTALALHDVTPVLRWVPVTSDSEVRSAFTKTMAVRALGPDARDLADRYFFETVVRLHRAGEGESFTGLKSTETEAEPSIVEADEALKTGSVDGVIKLVNDAASAGIRQRFSLVREKQMHADESVAAGREYVKAYVEYVRYVEELHQRAAAHGEDTDVFQEHPAKQAHRDTQESSK